MRLRYIGLGVVEVEAEAAFMRDVMALDPGADLAGYATFSAPESPEPYIVRLRPAPHDRVDVVAFATDSETLGACRAAAESTEASVVDVPAPDGDPSGAGFAVFDPDGHLIQITEDRAGTASAAEPQHDGRPRDISHVVFNSVDNAGLADWYCNVLGFRITDWLEDKLVFLTTDDLHHQLAIAAAPNNGTNHIAFRCADVDAFMRSAGRAIRQGNELLWGPGRHGPGDNTFAYFLDPSGFILEFTTGLESVADPNWEVRTWQSVPEQSDLWGTSNPRPNDVFLTPTDPGLGVVPGAPGEQ